MPVLNEENWVRSGAIAQWASSLPNHVHKAYMAGVRVFPKTLPHLNLHLFPAATWGPQWAGYTSPDGSPFHRINRDWAAPGGWIALPHRQQFEEPGLYDTPRVAGVNDINSPAAGDIKDQPWVGFAVTITTILNGVRTPKSVTVLTTEQNVTTITAPNGQPGDLFDLEFDWLGEISTHRMRLVQLDSQSGANQITPLCNPANRAQIRFAYGRRFGTFTGPYHGPWCVYDSRDKTIHISDATGLVTLNSPLTPAAGQFRFESATGTLFGVDASAMISVGDAATWAIAAS